MIEKNDSSEKTHVSRLHFLIHPGYCSYPEPFPRFSTKKIAAAKNKELNNSYMLEGYVQKAQTLNADELMFIITHTGQREFNADIKAGRVYAETVVALSELLGKRAIVLHDEECALFENKESDLAQSAPIIMAKQIAESRGYIFPKNVASEAYGETMECCVADGAESLNAAFHLTQETIIRTRLTDFMRETEENIHNAIGKLRLNAVHDCIIFDCE